MLWVSLGLVVVFGGATLLLQDETFIKWKPTVLYWLFATILAGSVMFKKKNLMKSLLSEQMQLPDEAWNTMNLSRGSAFSFSWALPIWPWPSIFPTDDLGQFQAVWRHGPDARLRSGTGNAAVEIH